MLHGNRRELDAIAKKVMSTTGMITSALRFVPLAGILSVLLIGVIWRVLLQRRRYGTSGIARFDLNEPAQLARTAGFILFFAGLGVQAFDAARNPAGIQAPTWLSPEGALVLSSAGAVMLIGGLVLLVSAQLQMGRPGGSVSTKARPPVSSITVSFVSAAILSIWRFLSSSPAMQPCCRHPYRF